LHLVGILFPHINDDARSKSHQICHVFLLFVCIVIRALDRVFFILIKCRVVTSYWTSKKKIERKKWKKKWKRQG